MPEQRHSVSVAGVIIDGDGRALLVRRRDNGHWEPPGGVLELTETVEEGLAREVAEETGLTVQIEALSGIYKNMPRGILALVFRCRSAGGKTTPNDEVSEFRWATDANLDDLMDPVYAVRARDAIHYNGTPAVRTHDGNQLIVSL